MPKLTAAQVAGIVTNPPTGSTTAEWVAKARQESGFDTDVQDFLGSGHWGLWQIADSHWDASWNNGGRTSGSKANFAAQLRGANFNWRQAQFLYVDDRQRGGDGWRPWRASGGKPTPSAADRAAAGSPDTSIGASGGEAGDLGEAIPGLGLPDPIGAVADAINRAVEVVVDAGKWLTDVHNIIRVAYVAGGLALAIAAASIIANPVISDVTKTTKSIKPI